MRAPFAKHVQCVRSRGSPKVCVAPAGLHGAPVVTPVSGGEGAVATSVIPASLTLAGWSLVAGGAPASGSLEARSPLDVGVALAALGAVSLDDSHAAIAAQPRTSARVKRRWRGRAFHRREECTARAGRSTRRWGSASAKRRCIAPWRGFAGRNRDESVRARQRRAGSSPSTTVTRATLPVTQHARARIAHGAAVSDSLMTWVWGALREARRRAFERAAQSAFTAVYDGHARAAASDPRRSRAHRARRSVFLRTGLDYMGLGAVRAPWRRARSSGQSTG
jgi:hypothetical protein